MGSMVAAQRSRRRLCLGHGRGDDGKEASHAMMVAGNKESGGEAMALVNGEQTGEDGGTMGSDLVELG